MLLIRLLRTFPAFFRKHTCHLFLYFLTAVAEFGCASLLPYIIGRVSDGLAKQSLTLPALNTWIGLTLALGLGMYLVRVYREIAAIRLGIAARRGTLRDIFLKVLRQDLPFFDRFTSGKLLTLTSTDADSVLEAMDYGIYSLSTCVLQTAINAAVMGITVGWHLTVFALLPFPVLMFMGLKLGKFWDNLYAAKQEEYEKMSELVLEDVNGIRVIRAYHTEDRSHRRFAEAADRFRKSALNYALIRDGYWPFVSLFTIVSYGICVFVGVPLVRTGQLSIGQLTSTFFYVEMFTWPAICLSEFILRARQGIEAQERINEVLLYPEVPETASFSPEEEKAFRIENIELHLDTFRYPVRKEVSVETGSAAKEAGTEAEDSKTTAGGGESKAAANALSVSGGEKSPGEEDNTFVLRDIHLTLPRGKVLAVVGPVGCGKSTLLKQFLRFYPGKEDCFRVNRRSLAEIPKAVWREHIAYVPQTNFLFSDSIQNNILLAGGQDLRDEAAEGEAAERLNEVVSMADLQKDLPQFPEGLLTQAGERGISLSGGQKQRISIARALYKRSSDLIILDDCLSAVDGTTEARILDNLRQRLHGPSLLIAAHRFSAVMYADEILVLKNGCIEARGKHDELLQTNTWYREQAILQGLITPDGETAKPTSSAASRPDVPATAAGFMPSSDATG